MQCCSSSSNPPTTPPRTRVAGIALRWIGRKANGH